MDLTLSNWEWTCCEFSTIALIVIVIIYIISAIKGGGSTKPTPVQLRYDRDLERVREIHFHTFEKNGTPFICPEETVRIPPNEHMNYYSYFVYKDPYYFQRATKIELFDDAGNKIPTDKYSFDIEIGDGGNCFFLNVR